MGFFTRSKKVKKKDSPSQPQDARRAPPSQCPPPPPSQASQPAPYQAAGYLPPPPSYSAVSPPTTSYHQHGGYPPIIVNQHHYYLGAPPPHQPPARQYTANTPLGKVNLGPAVELAKEVCQGTCIPRLIDGALPLWHSCGGALVSHGNALTDVSHRFNDALEREIYNHFDNIMTLIDQGRDDGKERDMFAWQPANMPSQSLPPAPQATESSLSRPSTRKSHRKENPKGQTTAAASIVSGSVFAKVDLYANSRLPMNLPPLKLYIPTYPLLCLAAQYSERVYEPPSARAERDAHVDGGWRTGTKAMVIKSVPMDYMNTIVFAIRGTSTFMDWAVNLNMEPVSPVGFLDDTDNLCHAGFLSVARKMIVPVARRLRQLLEEDPSRASYSLLITGHSAGGAVAALLYSHMHSTTPLATSELTPLATTFKRIHCVTFGAPPVSIYPLTKPDAPHLRKSLFLSFVNEGDPVTRADKAYVRSLLELFAAPPPSPTPPGSEAVSSSSGGRRSSSSRRRSSSTRRGTASTSEREERKKKKPVWRVPACTLSCAGRVVVLRSGDGRGRGPGRGKTTVEERLDEGVVAQVVTDEELRGVVWGDPVAHMMRLYAGRIEVLAVGAVTGRGY